MTASAELGTALYKWVCGRLRVMGVDSAAAEHVAEDVVDAFYLALEVHAIALTGDHTDGGSA